MTATLPEGISAGERTLPGCKRGHLAREVDPLAGSQTEPAGSVRSRDKKQWRRRMIGPKMPAARRCPFCRAGRCMIATGSRRSHPPWCLSRKALALRLHFARLARYTRLRIAGVRRFCFLPSLYD